MELYDFIKENECEFHANIGYGCNDKPEVQLVIFVHPYNLKEFADEFYYYLDDEPMEVYLTLDGYIAIEIQDLLDDWEVHPPTDYIFLISDKIDDYKTKLFYERYDLEYK